VRHLLLPGLSLRRRAWRSSPLDRGDKCDPAAMHGTDRLLLGLLIAVPTLSVLAPALRIQRLGWGLWGQRGHGCTAE
jgi:hypothetical protein